jgi:hypothetical protein
VKVYKHGQDEDDNEHGSGEDSDSHPLASTLLVLTHDLPARRCQGARRSCLRDMDLNVVELVALHLDEGDHVKEHHVQVHEATLKVLNEMTQWGIAGAGP